MVADGLGEVSDGLRMVTHGIGKETDGLLKNNSDVTWSWDGVRWSPECVLVCLFKKEKNNENIYKWYTGVLDMSQICPR